MLVVRDQGAGGIRESQELSRSGSLAKGHGSLAELETHLQIAERLSYLDMTQVKQILDKTAEVGRMLNGLRRSLEKRG